MDLLFLFLFWFVVVVILVRFGLDKLEIFTNITEPIFEYLVPQQENVMCDANLLEIKLNNLKLKPETKKIVLKESQDNYNYSVEWRRAENTRLLATAAIMVSMIAAFYTLCTHIQLVKGPIAIMFAALSILIFVVSCSVAFFYLFRAMSCDYATPPSTIDKILELEKIELANKNGGNLDFENSLSASNAELSYKNVQSNIKKGRYLGVIVKSIASALLGLAMLAFEIISLKLYPDFFLGG